MILHAYDKMNDASQENKRLLIMAGSNVGVFSYRGAYICCNVKTNVATQK